MQKITCYFLATCLLPFIANAQVTSSGIRGMVTNRNGQPIQSATVTIVHEPTQTIYQKLSRQNGYFEMGGLITGGPYSVTISAFNHNTLTKTAIHLLLGELYEMNDSLFEKVTHLGNLTVTANDNNSKQWGKVNGVMHMNKEKMGELPSSTHTVFDYLKILPQVNEVSGNEGAISIAGQNNRYNSFYVDGALNNDVFGLTNSGTNGGQTGSPPISMEAIEQLQLVLSPYHASIGNFTGGGINAVTRSGSNQRETALYHYQRMQHIKKTEAGQSNGIAYPTINVSATTFGFRNSGAIVKNKLFYFLSVERQSEKRIHAFAMDAYTGNTHTETGLDGLREFVKKEYQYDPGEYQQVVQHMQADRIALKMDWNMRERQRLTVTYRYNKSVAIKPGINSTDAIHFSNAGVMFPNLSHTITAELKTASKKNTNNKLLATYAQIKDDRSFLGDPFPLVTIYDGNGAITLGSESNSVQNRLLQKNISLTDQFRINTVNHSITTGVELEYSSHENVFIQNTLGRYRYASMASFITNSAPPLSYEAGKSMVDNDHSDNTKAAASFQVLRTALFISNEFRKSNNLLLTFGLRLDDWRFLSQPITDPFVNDTALSKISVYYDLKGARSGQHPVFPISLSPRIGFLFKIPQQAITLSGGIGIFAGRMPLVWPGGVYNNNGITTGNSNASATSLQTIRFRWNGANMADALWHSLPGTDISKGTLNLVSKKLHMPRLLRMSIEVDKKFSSGWNMKLSGMLSKNIHEIDYSNVNLVPPNQTSIGPGAQKVYHITPDGQSIRIPLTTDDRNPYENIILLSNNETAHHGFAYQSTLSANKTLPKNAGIYLSYSYGHATTWTEGTASINLSQWQQKESIGGKNNNAISRSDFSAGHKLVCQIEKKIGSLTKKKSTFISMVYAAQSGAPFSYVYGDKSASRDMGVNAFNELIYIPTSDELAQSLFLNNRVDGVLYTPAQQKEALENFIQTNAYLKKHRGSFAHRNGSRLPFTHSLDIKLRQDIKMKLLANEYTLQISLDILNVFNLLNDQWGARYELPFNQYPLIGFAGYLSNNNLTPTYRFNPQVLPKMADNVNLSGSKGNSSYWSARLGVYIMMK